MIDKQLFSLPGIKKVLLLLVGFTFMQALLLLTQSWTLSRAITNLWLGDPLFDQLTWLICFLASFLVLKGIATIEDSYLDSYAYRCSDGLRRKLLTHVFSLGPRLVQKHGTGNTTTTILEGVDQVETYLRLILPKMTRLLLIPLVLLVPVFFLDWVSGIVLVLVFPFIVLYMVLLGKTAQEKAARQHAKFQVMSNHFIDSLRGIDTLKFFGISASYGTSIFQVSEQFRKATIKTLRVATLSSLVLDLFATLSIAAVAILLGLRLLDGTLPLFPALTILVLAPEYFKPIREFAADFHASLDGKNALATINEMITTETTECTSSISEAADYQTITWTDSSTLQVRNLKFSYPDFIALDDISFKVQGNSKIGIVGASGAGKSTLIELLGGFASPDQGVFNINEASFQSLHTPHWQTQLAYLPQNPYIFHGTLRENITFYHPDACAKEIDSVVELVGLQDMVTELEQGLDTLIGEGARSLSGGQAQRIALARMYLDRSRNILLFDEPTAHLDIETERELKDRMLPLMEDRLVFFATHRLHWMNDMDFILVMDQGRIVECGTLEELLQKKGHLMTLVSRMEGGE